MRREFALVLSAIASLVPGGLVATLGDGRAQNGMALLLVAIPFYCCAVAAFIALVHKAIGIAGFRSFASYILSAFLASFLVALTVIGAHGGWGSALAASSSLLSAFVLVPAFEGRLHRSRT